ncbi:MAG: hypothetical protein WC867_01420 [Candidatus Pacearchaeota archaeon]|jgi:hypothetical protein
MVEIINGFLGGACGALFAYIIEKLLMKEIELLTLDFSNLYGIVSILLYSACILCGIIIAIKFTNLLKNRQVLLKK